MRTTLLRRAFSRRRTSFRRSTTTASHAQSADRLIYADAEHPLRYFSPWPSKDGQWLFIVASEGTSGTEVLYKKVSEPKFRTLLPGFDADYAPVECRDGQLYYVTNRDASNYALMKVDLNDPSKVSTVIPESGREAAGGRRLGRRLSFLPPISNMRRARSASTVSTGNSYARSNFRPSAR